MGSDVYAISWVLNSIPYEVLYPKLVKSFVSLHLKLWWSPKTVARFWELHPTKIIHGAIFVFGHVYEFSDEGIKKLKVIDPKNRDFPTSCKVSTMQETKFLGTTKVTQLEFERWLASEKLKGGRFPKSKYDISNNHCIVLAIAAARFLFPEEERTDVDICYFQKDTKTQKTRILVAYDYAFQFTSEGVKIYDSAEITLKSSGKSRGQTYMSLEEFEKWLVVEMKIGGKFTANVYDAKKNNSLHFATTAFEYLTGYPNDWESTCEFTKEFPKLCRTGHIITGTSSSSAESSSSLQYQQNLEKKKQQKNVSLV